MYDINEICEKVNGVFSKKICLKITRISSLKSAKENEISFFSDLKYFKDDINILSLQNWNKFEIEHPDIFRGMYQFWVKKTL